MIDLEKDDPFWVKNKHARSFYKYRKYGMNAAVFVVAQPSNAICNIDYHLGVLGVNIRQKKSIFVSFEVQQVQLQHQLFALPGIADTSTTKCPIFKKVGLDWPLPVEMRGFFLPLAAGQEGNGSLSIDEPLALY